jgi:hypothetical protein
MFKVCGIYAYIYTFKTVYRRRVQTPWHVCHSAGCRGYTQRVYLVDCSLLRCTYSFLGLCFGCHAGVCEASLKGLHKLCCVIRVHRVIELQVIPSLERATASILFVLDVRRFSLTCSFLYHGMASTFGVVCWLPYTSVDMWRLFGCMVFIHCPDEARTDHLQVRSILTCNVSSSISPAASGRYAK